MPLRSRSTEDTDPPLDEPEVEGHAVRRETDEADAEGHAARIKFGAPDTDQPPSDEGDTEGHKRHFGHAAPDTDESPKDDDAEGHIRGRS